MLLIIGYDCLFPSVTVHQGYLWHGGWCLRKIL